MGEGHHINIVATCGFQFGAQVLTEVNVGRSVIFATSAMVKVHQNTAAVRQHNLAGVTVANGVERYLIDYVTHMIISSVGQWLSSSPYEA
jgi:hypothetical protein